MGFFSKLQHNLKELYKGNSREENTSLDHFDVKNIGDLQHRSETDQPIELPNDEIVPFTEEVLDTNSRENIEKFKHNLEILIKRAKEKGKVDKFMLIREDDFFPDGWEWRVLSKNTNFEKVATSLSYKIREAYALEQNGINPYSETIGIKVPIPGDQVAQSLSKIDKTLGNVLLPSRFRSTKHFTVNTPLEATGNYNLVDMNRDHVIIDDIHPFLASEYAYSISYHDAYLDVSHESLPISVNAIDLIKDEDYDRIMSDEKIASQLAQRRVVRVKGDIDIAIDMILTENGALPSQVGTKYANYDDEIRIILDSSIRELAEKNNLFFNKAHAGKLKLDGGGHFSNYYDEKNQDFEQAYREFVGFLRKKFPEHEAIFQSSLAVTSKSFQEVIQTIGTAKLLEAIDAYNKLASKQIEQRLEAYKQDRKKITPEIHQKFVATIHLIDDFYKTHTNCETYEQEEAIQKFIQGDTVEEQLQSAERVWDLLTEREQDKSKTTANSENVATYNEDKKIMPAEAIETALRVSTTSTVNEAERIEKAEREALNPEKASEGVSIDD